jgi:hypothetical protein
MQLLSLNPITTAIATTTTSVFKSMGPPPPNLTL